MNNPCIYAQKSTSELYEPVQFSSHSVSPAQSYNLFKLWFCHNPKPIVTPSQIKKDLITQVCKSTQFGFFSEQETFHTSNEQWAQKACRPTTSFLIIFCISKQIPNVFFCLANKFTQNFWPINNLDNQTIEGIYRLLIKSIIVLHKSIKTTKLLLWHTQPSRCVSQPICLQCQRHCRTVQAKACRKKSKTLFWCGTIITEVSASQKHEKHGITSCVFEKLGSLHPMANSIQRTKAVSIKVCLTYAKPLTKKERLPWAHGHWAFFRFVLQLMFSQFQEGPRGEDPWPDWYPTCAISKKIWVLIFFAISCRNHILF